MSSDRHSLYCTLNLYKFFLFYSHKLHSNVWPVLILWPKKPWIISFCCYPPPPPPTPPPVHPPLQHPDHYPVCLKCWPVNVVREWTIFFTFYISLLCILFYFIQRPFFQRAHSCFWFFKNNENKQHFGGQAKCFFFFCHVNETIFNQDWLQFYRLLNQHKISQLLQAIVYRIYGFKDIALIN